MAKLVYFARLCRLCLQGQHEPTNKTTMWRPPSDVCWFRFAPVTIVIACYKPYSYWSYLQQLSYRTGASHCRAVPLCSQ